MKTQGLKLKNYSTGQTQSDKLHEQEINVQNNCTEKRCLGSMMLMPGYAAPERSREELISMAKEFLQSFFASTNSVDSDAHTKRWDDVMSQINEMGTYDLTEDELLYGAKLAWRNASRCIGRIQWNKLKLYDARHVRTASEMFKAICTHLEYGTNEGNIRSTITVFPQRRAGQPDFRVWNTQLIGYAGYKMEDGSIKGDPAGVEFTKVCQKLGWEGKGTQWDILPMVLSNGVDDPEVFDLPPELVLQVPLSHPTFEWFATLNLQWYAMPAVSGMLFDVGGIQFPACPFNGWYMVTEVACRDLCDPQRYNVLELVAAEMGEDTSSPATLWKDRALVEVNVAVLHSFQLMTVTIVDHHTASDNFIKHLDNEQRARKGCPADWVWIVPPMSGSLTSVFHQEMVLYSLKPSYEYQIPAWRTYDWGEQTGQGPRFTLRQIARVVQASVRLYTSVLKRRVKVTIVYATETGRSQMFANQLEVILAYGFNPKVVCMADYDFTSLKTESLILVVTSTFGNGDAPDNGQVFARKLSALIDKKTPVTTEPLRTSQLNGNANQIEMSQRNTGPLHNVRFSVFALGSSVYPHFCAFGHHIDHLLGQLGGQRLMQVEEADEMGGQEKVFRQWLATLYPKVCKSFNVEEDKTMLAKELASSEVTLTAETVRLVQARGEMLDAALSKTFKKHVNPCKLLKTTSLCTSENGNTVLLEISSDEEYIPGDHVGVYPENRRELVDGILDRLECAVNPNQPVKLQLQSQKKMQSGTVNTWVPFPGFPTVSLRTLLSRFLDITTPLKPQQLEKLAVFVSDPVQRANMMDLATDVSKYETWRDWHVPHLLEVMEQFPSLKVPPALLVTILQPLQPRFYSISSSPLANHGQIHITVAVVKYRTKDGSGPVHYGACSNYLNDASAGDSVYMFVRKAHNFSLPSNPSTPVIMVAAGTGIAPFRGFWQQSMVELGVIKEDAYKNEMNGMWLFFGCRTREMDLFRDEKEEAVRQRVMDRTFLALSREPGVPKTYVQYLLLREGATVFRKLHSEGGHFYVCGDVSMAESVVQMLVSIAQMFGPMDEEAAQKFIKKLKEEKRYHEDIFGVIKHGKPAAPQKSSQKVIIKTPQTHATIGMRKKVFRLFWC